MSLRFANSHDQKNEPNSTTRSLLTSGNARSILGDIMKESMASNHENDNRRRAVALSAAASVLLLCGCTPIEGTQDSDSVETPTATVTPENNVDDSDFTGGCNTFAVYAQNRWVPYGAAVRAEPDVLSKKLEPSFAPNEVIAVDGWVTGAPTYPTNPAPWNEPVYLHLHNRNGWVSYPGVRAAPTRPDPTLRSAYGGKPVRLRPECKGTYHEDPSEQ
jgi:hypothetical protein